MRIHDTIVTLIFLIGTPVLAQNWDTVKIIPHVVTSGVYMLEGQGGNIGVLTGEDGILVIDDQYPELAPKIMSAIAKISQKDIRFVINTHWHGDHVGGNQALSEAGAIVVAQENVRTRMSTDQFMEWMKRDVPARPKAALPVITFQDRITFHFNNKEILVYHGPPAHTDGDAVIWIKESNVIHTGDTFVTYGFPFIDESAGGSLNGLIAFLGEILEMINDETKVIPGHGPISSRQDIVNFRAKLIEIRGKILPLIEAGKSRDEVITENPLSYYDDNWSTGWIKSKDFITLVYAGLKADLEK